MYVGAASPRGGGQVAAFGMPGTIPVGWWGAGALSEPRFWSSLGLWGLFRQVMNECDAITDNPHMSGHAPGKINVVGRTTCLYSVKLLSIETRLQLKRGCFLFFCSWTTVDTGINGAWDTKKVQANAAAACTPGTYRGRTAHTVWFYSGNRPTVFTTTSHFTFTC